MLDMVSVMNVLLWLAAGIVLLVIGASSVCVIEEQSVGIVQRWGQFSRTLNPGLHFVFYPVEALAGRVSLRIDQVSETVEIKTADNMFVSLPVTIMIRAKEGDGAKAAFYQLRNPQQQIKRWVLNTVRSATAGMATDQVFKDRTVVKGAVNDLAAQLSEFGYCVEDVLVDQPTLSAEVQAAFSDVIASERLKEAATNKAAAAKITIEAQAAAEAEAQRLRAKGLADARTTIAEGLCSAMDSFKDKDVDPDAVMRLLLETNWIDAVRDVGRHGNLVLMGSGMSGGGADLNGALTGLLARGAVPRASSDHAQGAASTGSVPDAR